MRISFIIPCYNVSQTVRRCLDSIYSLGLQEDEFEVIAVNDASTDDTLQILRKYTQDHANLVVLNHLVNRNLGAARNTGLAVARGECIAFVDGDDEAKPGIVDALRRMEEKNLDMVAMRVERVVETGEIRSVLSLPYVSDEVFEGTRLMTEHPYWISAVWGYLYRRAFLVQVQYPFAEGLYYEDSDFVYRHLYYTRQMAYCDGLSYQQNQTLGSITNSFSFNNVVGYTLLGTRMLALYEEIEDKTRPYAYSVLEGGSYNMNAGLRKLLRLQSVRDVRTVFNHLDVHFDRKSLLSNKESSHHWTFWTRLCLKHRYLATAIAGMVVSLPILQGWLRRL